MGRGKRKLTPEQDPFANRKLKFGARSEKGKEKDESEEPDEPNEVEVEVEVGLGDYDSIKSAPEDRLRKSKPIATCSFNYRYHDNKGQGALKYDPVTCSRIHDPGACQKLRELRGGQRISFTLKTLITPGCTDFQRKVLAVPSVGLPKMLYDPNVVKHLLWAREAKKRPTVLVVHSSEEADYRFYLTKLLKKLGVGLASWSSREPVLGFGVSRLAATLYGNRGGQRGDVVLCDVNVVADDNVASGYHSDNENYDSDDDDALPVKGTTLYVGAGRGSGIPMYEFNKGLVSTKKTPGGATRPIEQVVTVGDELLYDPCFITSSEDADLTASFLFDQIIGREDRGLNSVSFKRESRIKKLDIGAKSHACNKYMELRNKYLSSLEHEDGVTILYSKDKKQNPIKVGQLARNIANSLELDPVVIRSLIIEKILLAFKKECLYKT